MFGETVKLYVACMYVCMRPFGDLHEMFIHIQVFTFKPLNSQNVNKLIYNPKTNNGNIIVCPFIPTIDASSTYRYGALMLNPEKSFNVIIRL